MIMFGSLFGLMILGLVILIMFRIFIFVAKLIAIGVLAMIVFGFMAGNHFHCSSDNGSFDCQTTHYEHAQPYKSGNGNGNANGMNSNRHNEHNNMQSDMSDNSYGSNNGNNHNNNYHGE
jgi:predicted lipid-binding transport protein (Tim44 family)